jgi:hypothetical protein
MLKAGERCWTEGTAVSLALYITRQNLAREEMTSSDVRLR